MNLVDRVVEVYREPGADAAASCGWRYRSVEVFGPDASVSVLALRGAHVRVADLLA